MPAPIAANIFAWLLPTIRSRCVAIPVPKPPADAASAWLAAQGARNAGRWLAYAGGAPLMALEYASEPAAVERLIEAVRTGRPVLPDTREELEALAEVLQKFALDQALATWGLAPLYGLADPKPGSAQARLDWISFARRMGPARALARHPLNPRLFAAELLAGVPRLK